MEMYLTFLDIEISEFTIESLFDIQPLPKIILCPPDTFSYEHGFNATSHQQQLFAVEYEGLFNRLSKLPLSRLGYNRLVYYSNVHLGISVFGPHFEHSIYCAKHEIENSIALFSEIELSIYCLALKFHLQSTTSNIHEYNDKIESTKRILFNKLKLFKSADNLQKVAILDYFISSLNTNFECFSFQSPNCSDINKFLFSLFSKELSTAILHFQSFFNPILLACSLAPEKCENFIKYLVDCLELVNHPFDVKELYSRVSEKALHTPYLLHPFLFNFCEDLKSQLLQEQQPYLEIFYSDKNHPHAILTIFLIIKLQFVFFNYVGSFKFKIEELMSTCPISSASSLSGSGTPPRVKALEYVAQFLSIRNKELDQFFTEKEKVEFIYKCSVTDGYSWGKTTIRRQYFTAKK